MTTTIRTPCPHCGQTLIVTVTAPLAIPIPKPAPRAKASGRVCGCGHEAAFHLSGTLACSYGHGTAHGGCTCTAYHSRRKGLADARMEMAAGDVVHRDAKPSNVRLGRGERAILSVLLQRADRTTSRLQLAIRTLYRHDAGGFGNLLSALRTAGLIDGPSTAISATPAAMQAVGVTIPFGRTAEHRVSAWLPRLGACEREILKALGEQYPGALPREELADLTGYQADGGGFGNALSHLRGLGLIEGERGAPLRATAALMEDV